LAAVEEDGAIQLMSVFLLKGGAHQLPPAVVVVVVFVGRTVSMLAALLGETIGI